MVVKMNVNESMEDKFPISPDKVFHKDVMDDAVHMLKNMKFNDDEIFKEYTVKRKNGKSYRIDVVGVNKHKKVFIECGNNKKEKIKEIKEKKYCSKLIEYSYEKYRKKLKKEPEKRVLKEINKILAETGYKVDKTYKFVRFIRFIKIAKHCKIRLYFLYLYNSGKLLLGVTITPLSSDFDSDYILRYETSFYDKNTFTIYMQNLPIIASSFIQNEYNGYRPYTTTEWWELKFAFFKYEKKTESLCDYGKKLLDKHYAEEKEERRWRKIRDIKAAEDYHRAIG